MKKKVVIGMSGGVDSSVAAYLLKKEGFDVIGVTMILCSEVDPSKDAKKVADKLNIPHYTIDLRDEFKKYVIDYFANEYISGKTPNPCVKCNKYIKFGIMLEKAKELGAEYIATGHYAKIEEHNGRYLIIKSEDDNKDQTYMLYTLTQEVLKKILMPCGKYEKKYIREIAENIGLEIYNKKDSMEICFIPNGKHGEYIKKMNKKQVVQGNFVDKFGNILGKHKGIVYYTIGQRKGLGIALGKPVYVIDIIPEKNQVVLGEEKDIFKTKLIAKELNFIPFDTLKAPLKVEAKIRYSAKPTNATIIPLENDKAKVVFEGKQRAITKGQSVVFYIENLLIGGGIIEQIV